MKIILLDETKRMVPLLTANSPWFGWKNGSKLDNHFRVSQFPTKLRRVSHQERYHSLRLIKKNYLRFWITRFRWLLKKLWTFKVYPVSGEFFQFFCGPVTFEAIFRPSPVTIGLQNRYILVLHFPIFNLIYYESNLVKKRLSYETLKIVQRVFNEMTIYDVFDQSQGPFLLIFNVRNQNDVFDQCQGPFVIKNPK